MSRELLLMTSGGLLAACGVVIYLKAQRSLSSEEKKLLESSLANPSPVTTAVFVAFLVGTMGLLVVISLLTGAGSRVLFLAPPCVCIASFVKAYVGVKPLQLSTTWKERFLLGLALACAGVSLGFAGFASRFLLS